MSEWKIVIGVGSMTGDHDYFEEQFNDVLPEAVLMTLLNGNFALTVRGVDVFGIRPRVDFSRRTLRLCGESANQKPEARP